MAMSGRPKLLPTETEGMSRSGDDEQRAASNDSRGGRFEQRNSREGRIRQLWKFFTTWKTPIHDRIINVGSFLISLSGIVATIILASNDYERRSAALISTSIAAAVLAVLVYSLVRQLWTATNEIARSRMTEDAAIKIADRFCDLVTRQSEFEGAVTTYVAKYMGARLSENEKLTEKDFGYVSDLCGSYIRALVHTAAYVIPTKKGHPTDTCAANLKLVVWTSSDMQKAATNVFYRSDHAAKKRHDADRLARETNSFPLLSANRMYLTAMQTARHVLVGDLPAYVKMTDSINEENRRLKRATFDEPSDETIDDYTSCLLVPIHGIDTILRLLDNKTGDAFVPIGREGQMVGLFCIDSKQPDYFDSDYDLSVMTQLANHAFSAIRTFYVVGAMRASYEQANSAKPVEKR